MPGYKPTPLVDLAGLARAAGIARIWYKDEGSRFGLKSFKAVGGAYAVLRLLQREIKRRTGEIRASAIDIIDGKYRDEVSAITLTCATTGVQLPGVRTSSDVRASYLSTVW